MKSLPFIVFSIFTLCITGCIKSPQQVLQDKRKGELTRELAAELLNERFAQKAPPIDQLDFQENGYDKAKRDGIITRGRGMDIGVYFTERGRKMLDGVGNPDGSLINPSNISFRGSLRINERVREVTGIAAEPMSGGMSVEFTTEYILPQPMQPMSAYIVCGRKAQTEFKKYDDGWRVLP